MERTLSAHAGVHCNMGKTRVWNRGGIEPPGVRELGPEVWVGGAERPAEQRGVKVLGTPLGIAEYATALGKKRYEKQNTLLKCLPKLPDLQSAWLLLQQCAGPRFNYRARTVPPTENTEYASAHDTGMWHALCALLGKDPLAEDRNTHAERVATLPQRLGGLGLRSAVRTGAAAY